jgi:hypothetical protein
VRGLPDIVTLPKMVTPVPNWSGSGTLPPRGESAMTIEAVTELLIGAAAVPISRTPVTWRFVTFRLEFALVEKESFPSTATVYATAEVVSTVTV